MSVAESSPALWQPSHEQIKSTNLHQFIGVVSEKLSLPSANYDEFHQWSNPRRGLALWVRHEIVFDHVVIGLPYFSEQPLFAPIKLIL